MFISIKMVFLANVKLAFVASIGAILYSFAFAFVHIVNILSRRGEVAVFVIFLHNCTYLTFDLTVTLNQKITLFIHPYIVCNSPIYI